jgi:hypothetical protein
VLFVDTGHTEQIPAQNAREIPTELLVHQPQAYLCCLQPVLHEDGLPESSVTLFNRVLKSVETADCEFHAPINPAAVQPKFIVQLFVNGENVWDVVMRMQFTPISNGSSSGTAPSITPPVPVMGQQQQSISVSVSLQHGQHMGERDCKGICLFKDFLAKWFSFC